MPSSKPDCARALRRKAGTVPPFSEPEVYEQEELDKLFAVCDAEERLWYEFFLMTGEREQEVMYTEWRDINLVGSIARVTHKPDNRWPTS
jgi:integrase/recombinase XerD